MKLLSLKIEKADSCGGLLDGLFISFRSHEADTKSFDPLCLIGPNGSGKSQLLQVIAEIFQTAFHKYLPAEERGTPNDGLMYEIEYLICTDEASGASSRVRLSRVSKGKRKPELIIEVFENDEWRSIDNLERIPYLLPSIVVGYTSGSNETLSLPFFSSRSGYAKEVRESALKKSNLTKILDPRLMLIDYGTNLEVLVANLLLNSSNVQQGLLDVAGLRRLRSFRCVVQLNHTAARGGIKLTEELEAYIANLKSCATCYSYSEKNDSYIFDYFVTKSTQDAFKEYWSKGVFSLYSSFHKLAMLNDLIIPNEARKQYQKGLENRRFASRLPEPFDDHKVFRFEKVEFITSRNSEVDYVSLSDGEHQLAQLLGTMCMISSPNAIFLLDEPESHFNPRWRVELMSKIKNFPVNVKKDSRAKPSSVARQEMIITTHSPFVPSDMKSEKVFIFSKNKKDGSLSVRWPKIETYGSTFDAILSECFDIDPPMSDLPRHEIEKLMQSKDAGEIKDAMSGLGESVEKLFLADRMRTLSAAGGD